MKELVKLFLNGTECKVIVDGKELSVDDMNAIANALCKRSESKPLRHSVQYMVSNGTTRVFKEGVSYRCPSCGKDVYLEGNGYEKPAFCCFCGQAIDWSEEEEK